jgi:hypothetical protein
MNRSASSSAPTRKDLASFLDELSVRYGYCLPRDEKEKFLQIAEFDAESFARELLRAERMDPDTNVSQFRQVKKMFIDRYGASNFSVDGETGRC